jgi:hypothetical protein
VICPGCQRDNQAARRYCGGCGCNFEPACQSCGFSNDHVDRFCGGCGTALRAEDIQPRRVIMGHQVAAARHVAARPAPPATSWPADELAGLFEPAAVGVEESDLPEAGIIQGDVDRLFGGVS